MRRLIDADALKTRLNEKCFFGEISACDAFEIINNAPTVEVTDVEDIYNQGYTAGWKDRFGEPSEKPYGEWLTEKHSRIIHCSRCNAEENLNNILKAKYCWQCGAKMNSGNVTCKNCTHINYEQYCASCRGRYYSFQYKGGKVE